MSSVILRIAQGAFFAVFTVCVALWVVGMAEWSKRLLAPMLLLVGVQLGALVYETRREPS